MTSSEALETIKGLVGAGRWEIERTHCQQRMRQRGVTVGDVRHALLHATASAHQPENDRWRVDSKDLEGDELMLIVRIDDDVLVITVF